MGRDAGVQYGLRVMPQGAPDVLGKPVVDFGLPQTTKGCQHPINPERQEAPMFRPLASQSPLELRKWCAYALLLLAPGSFVVLPALWLVRHLAFRSRHG
jgi:hypothetical protein